jgi:hypothetical protein
MWCERLRLDVVTVASYMLRRRHFRKSQVLGDMDLGQLIDIGVRDMRLVFEYPVQEKLASVPLRTSAAEIFEDGRDALNLLEGISASLERQSGTASGSDV